MIGPSTCFKIRIYNSDGPSTSLISSPPDVPIPSGGTSGSASAGARDERVGELNSIVEISTRRRMGGFKTRPYNAGGGRHVLDCSTNALIALIVSPSNHPSAEGLVDRSDFIETRDLRSELRVSGWF